MSAATDAAPHDVTGALAFYDTAFGTV